MKSHLHIKSILISFLCQINLESNIQGADFALRNTLCGAAKLTKNAYPDKYKYSYCGIGFNARRFFLFSDGSGFGKIFGSDMRSLMHIDNQKKYLLILIYGSAEDLDDTALNKDKEYSILY